MKNRRLLRVLFILLSMLGVGVTGVSAHAFVTRTDPVDGAVLSEAPRQVRLWFSEEIALNLSKFAVIDSHGQSVPITSVQLDPSGQGPVVLVMPDLQPDAYRVTWDALSTEDLHITSGSIVFGVQTATAGLAIAKPDPAPPAFEVIGRWVDFVALATLIGALALSLLALPPVNATTPTIATTEHRLLTLATFAAGAALITAGGGVLVQAANLSSGDSSTSTINAAFQLLTQTSYGARWLMREGWTIALLCILVWQRRQPRVNRVVLAATTPLVFALLVLNAMNGHATSFNDTSLVRIAADALHLLGAGLWVGSLLALAIAIVPLLRRGPEESALARFILRRFGLIAAASLGVLFVTGLYNSGQQVASIDALLFTLYGRSLLVKIMLVMAIGLIGLINSSLLHPRVADVIRRVLHRPIGWTLVPTGQLRRTVMLEALGASCILLVAALLGSSQPARGPEFDLPSEEAAVKTVAANVADLSVTFSIKPNRPGQNFVSIGAFDTRRPAPAPIKRVIVRFTAPGGAGEFEREANLINNGKYQITGDAINMAGDWQMTVAVQRPGLADAIWTLPWTVVSPTEVDRRPVQISNQPLAPWLNVAAALSAVIIVGVGLAFWRSRRGHAKSQVRESGHDIQSLRPG